MRVYLDTCVYGRPSDDQSQPRIQREAAAFVAILAGVDDGRLHLIGSDILNLEVHRNPSVAERERIETFLTLCSDVVAQSQEVLGLAQRLHALTLRPRDALHVASAATGGAHYFVTCDDSVVKKGAAVTRLLKREGMSLQVVDPLTLRWSP